MEKVKAAIGAAFRQDDRGYRTTASATTITMQEIVAGAAVSARSVDRVPDRARHYLPLSGLTSGMKELAGGNFGVVLPGLDRKDEVGDMAQAVESFKVKAAEKARDEAEAKIRQDQVAASSARRT